MSSSTETRVLSSPSSAQGHRLAGLLVDVARHLRLVLAVGPGAVRTHLGIEPGAEVVVDHPVVGAGTVLPAVERVGPAGQQVVGDQHVEGAGAGADDGRGAVVGED